MEFMNKWVRSMEVITYLAQNTRGENIGRIWHPRWEKNRPKGFISSIISDKDTNDTGI